MKSSDIRQKFFDFFVARGHTKVASSPLIPANDPTLMFANAGMNQFKDIFLGKEKRSYTRAVTIQKCLRAGGKHNDLDNVGRTARHHTYFEMLGNFSFGDYFKREAIRYAFDFLTQEIKLDPEKLYASVYEHDDEAYDIWHKEMGFPTSRIVRLGRKDNFWQMGDTGPCGPCSEIYYDRGAKTEAERQCKPGDECERFLEIWNLVFIQFDRQADGSEIPLASKGVDTGMGLERLCAVVEDVPTNYDTDIFAALMAATEKLSNKHYRKSDHETQTAFKVLADHIRATCLAIADGGTPSNEGRGYVLRKIIRRAALFAQNLGGSMIFAQLAPFFIDEMSGVYPELNKNRELITSLITNEIEKFSHNLIQGKLILDRYLAEHAQAKKISGEAAFKLYDTYGFPLELTSIVAHEKGFAVDEAGFEQAMERQREQSGKKLAETAQLVLSEPLVTTFVGYDALTVDTVVTGLVVDGAQVSSVMPSSLCWVVTAETPIYVESGGQASDQATVTIENLTTPVLAVQKVDKAIALCIETPYQLSLGSTLRIVVNPEKRANTMRNHTATHLLQAALTKLLGTHIKQAGSQVSHEYLRFDFAHHEALSQTQLDTVERTVNAIICENRPVATRVTTYQDALQKGVTAFFGEKYNPEAVRVVEVQQFSAELCGGTHVHATGEIGCFKITASTALAAGVRRITAVTGPEAVLLFQNVFNSVHSLTTFFKVQTDEVVQAVEKQAEVVKKLEQELARNRKKQILNSIPQWLSETNDTSGTPFGFIYVEGVTAKEIREVALQLGQKKHGVYFVYTQSQTGYLFYLYRSVHLPVTHDLADLAKILKAKGLKGGLSEDAFQGGCTELPTNLEMVINNWLSQA